MRTLKRLTDIDYIHMGKSDDWKLDDVCAMLTWFSLSERAYLEEYDEFIVYETEDEVPEDRDSSQHAATLAFLKIYNAIYDHLFKAFVERKLEQVERLYIEDLEEGKVGRTELCLTRDSALSFLQERSTGIDTEKLKRFLLGKEVSGRKDKVVEALINAYGAEKDSSVTAKSMAEIRHEKEKPFKDALQVRIDDYFSEDCSCTSKTAFEQMKKQWPNENAMRADVKLGYYTLNERIKATLQELEKSSSEQIVRRCQAKNYRKEKIPTSCKKHRRTILK